MLRGGLVAALCALAVPAAAGWRYAEWGMTPDDVRAAADGPIGRFEVAERRAWGVYPELVSVYANMRHRYRVEFYFDKATGGLSAVRLVPQGRFWCLDVRDELFERLGYRHRYIDNRLTWEAPEANNRVVLAEGSSRCTVRYEPLRGPAD